MKSKYVDATAMTQVIGCIFKEPTLLDKSDSYVLIDEDFPDEFHHVVFGTIYNLSILGVSEITLDSINDYLESRPKNKQIYDKNHGNEYLSKLVEIATPSTFDYYYNRLKKMSLLRAYDNIGLDVSEFYDPDNISDIKKKEYQEDWLDNTSLSTIASQIDQKIDKIKEKYVDNDVFGESVQAGAGILDLIKQFQESPDVGVPLYGRYINTITRGARLGKFYLRSAPTGVGKTRMMAADACYISCTELYDDQFGWISNGIGFPTLIIGTEQDLSEIQTLLLSFVSGVNEDHILYSTYKDDEYERVIRAAKIIEESPLYVEELPEFNLIDVENTIKRNIRDKGVQYVFNPNGFKGQ